MFISYCRHCLGSLQINHSCCLIIHVHLIHCICYKWTFMASSLGHHHIPCHHMCHATSSTIPCHAITTLVFHWVFHVIISTGYSFVICEHLWHQWQLHTQQSSPLALMATSKHSPPLTTMTKDNLLCQWCTYFDIGFPIFLLFDNSPYYHISPLLTGLCYLINVLWFILTFPLLQQVLGWYLNW